VPVDLRYFLKVRMPDPSDPQRVYKTEDVDLRLRPGSPAVDAGIELPSITDGFTGRAPDLGAYESDRPCRIRTSLGKKRPMTPAQIFQRGPAHALEWNRRRILDQPSG